jgi:lipopolysaccharide transport system permease protein
VSATIARDRSAEAAPATAGGRRRLPVRHTGEGRDGVGTHVRELIRYRGLLYRMAEREVKVRYRQTALGIAWALLQPFSLMLAFTVFFSWFAGLPSDGMPYPLFSYAALLPWTFFATALSFAIPSLIANSHVITKVYFPREIVPLATVAAALVDFGIATVGFAGLLVFYRIAPTWNVLYVLPLLTIQLVFTTALCLGLSAITALYRDVRFALPLVIQLWMFATPILYPLSLVPESVRGPYLALNPMAVVVSGYRQVVLQGRPPEHGYMALAGLVSLGLLLAAYRAFKRLERQFADIL